jgi:hypothetical protein
MFPALKHLPSWMPGASFKKWVKPWTEEGRSLLYDTYNLSKKRIVSQVLPSLHPLWTSWPRPSQDEGTATTSFISEALQTVAPEKMTIEDEEVFMQVAIQMYGGMLSPLRLL